MRTTPHALLARPPLSLARAREDARRRAWADNPRPSLRDLRAAGQSLTEDGRATFSVEELIVRVGELGGRWSPFTLRELLTREAAAANGCLARVREGVYSLRGEPGVAVESTDAAGAVLSALRSLAAEGRAVVTRRDVEAAIAAAGMPYSSRAVRAGLLALLQTERPTIDRMPGHRYVLSGDDSSPMTGGGAA